MSATRPSASTVKPNSAGSWETITTSATPFRKPMRIGLDSRSVTNPNRRAPPTTRTRPTSRARRPASATRRSAPSEPAAASGTIAAPMIGASDESGPRTSTRDGPTRAYATRAAMLA